MRTRTLAAALLCCLLCACVTGGADSEDLAEATELSPQRRLELARAAHSADPDDPQANLDLARALTSLERPDWRRAEAPARVAFDSGELDAPAGRILGKIYWEIGDPIETVSCWRAARAADPTSVRDSDFLYALRSAITTATTFHRYDVALPLRYELLDFVEAHHGDLEDGTVEIHDLDDVDDLIQSVSPDAFTTAFSDYVRFATEEGTRDDAVAFLTDLSRTREDPDDPIHAFVRDEAERKAREDAE
jgi:hypothetical protein